MILIRRATIGDLPQLSVLFNSYRFFYKQGPNVNACEIFLKERIENDQSVIIVAEENSELIGFTQLYPIYSSVSLAKAWLLNDLYVNEKSRNKGVATMLLNSSKQVGVETGARWLLLQTGKDNNIAHSLYEKNGWVKETDFFYRHDI